MIGTIAKAVAYHKAPKTTFALFHPKKALQLRRLRRDFRSSPATRMAAAGAAVTAAALALPIGLWLGRRNSRDDMYA